MQDRNSCADRRAANRSCMPSFFRAQTRPGWRRAQSTRFRVNVETSSGNRRLRGRWPFRRCPNSPGRQPSYGLRPLANAGTGSCSSFHQTRRLHCHNAILQIIGPPAILGYLRLSQDSGFARRSHGHDRRRHFVAERMLNLLTQIFGEPKRLMSQSFAASIVGLLLCRAKVTRRNRSDEIISKVK